MYAIKNITNGTYVRTLMHGEIARLGRHIVGWSNTSDLEKAQLFPTHADAAQAVFSQAASGAVSEEDTSDFPARSLGDFIRAYTIVEVMEQTVTNRVEV